MRTAIQPTTGVATNSVMTIRPYDQWYSLSLERRDSRQACDVCVSSGPGSLIDIRVVAAPPAVYELLDVADASWEDAEWR